MLSADLPTAGAFYVVVDGAEEGEEGTFELSVLCTQLPIAKEPEEACGHQVNNQEGPWVTDVDAVFGLLVS